PPCACPAQSPGWAPGCPRLSRSRRGPAGCPCPHLHGVVVSEVVPEVVVNLEGTGPVVELGTPVEEQSVVVRVVVLVVAELLVHLRGRGRRCRMDIVTDEKNIFE